MVKHTDERIRDVLLNGIADIDIRREALSSENIHNRPINEIIAFVEAREIARNASPSIGVSSLSEYRRFRGKSADQRSSSPSASDNAKTMPCPDCGSVFHIFTHKSRGWNKKPHERCANCWKRRRNEKKSDQAANNTITVQDPNPFGQICAMSSNPAAPPSPCSDIIPQTNKSGQPKQVTLHHHIFAKRECAEHD